MTSLSVEPEDGEAEWLGKTVSDLQEDIVVGDTSISGTLKYVTGYTGWSSNPEEQEGHYLALKFDPPENATTTVQVLGGTHGPVELDSDNVCIFRITNNRQKIKVVSTVNETVITNVYNLKRLALLPSA